MLSFPNAYKFRNQHETPCGLQELVLQEEGIEKIELLGTVCPHLKILYMPNNLISKLGENNYENQAAL